jgi:hypothetical protein
MLEAAKAKYEAASNEMDRLRKEIGVGIPVKAAP